ncbi:MAG: 3-phosphoshikimate 1-carboxyvinyltransferase [Azospirillaceae bacterium]
MQPLFSHPADALAGRAAVPGDKSISHRALMLGALAVGETAITGLLEAADVLATAAAMRALGAEVERGADGIWRVHGVGVGGLTEPAGVLDMGNSGTSTRLIAGLLASHRLVAFVTGDASLVKRPMARITRPLSAIGARFVCRSGERLPMAVLGTDEGVPIRYEPEVASAQVKSAILLAGLNVPGETTVIERTPTRAYTETMLAHFGASVRVEPAEGGGEAITVAGQPELTAGPVGVPADPSAAAFPMVAAAIRPGSDVVLPGVGLNERRAGLITTLREMGASIEALAPRVEAGEPLADLRVRGGALSGVDVPAERAASMIDEYPALAIAAACAEGPTRMTGIGELRVKESDRLAVTADGLAACGVTVETGEDWMVVHGAGAERRPRGGATVATALDHRIAMSFLVLGLAAEAPVGIDDAEPIGTSFPGFVALMNGLGARIAEAGKAPAAAGGAA